MPNFIFAYHGGSMPETPEEGKAVMAKWEAWMGGMGDAMTHPGAPVGMSKTVDAKGVADNGGSNPLSGFTLVEAADMDAATELAKGCPICEAGGSVEVAEMMSMSP
ncbi:MAG: YciI family protein [Sulfitobacter sp.]